MSSDIVRILGCNVREVLVTRYAQHGADLGMAIAQRFVWECGDVCSEIHGVPFAAAMLYRAGDALLMHDRAAAMAHLDRVFPPPVMVMPEPEPLPEPPPPAPEVPVVWTIRARLQATRKFAAMALYVWTHKGPPK